MAPTTCTTRAARLAELVKVRRVWDEAWEGAEDHTEGLIQLCRDWIKPDMVMVEVGSFAGVSTEIFALHAHAVYCVDPWEPYGEGIDEKLADAERRFDEVASRYLRVRKMKMRSLDAAAQFQDGRLNAVYIDGSHLPDDVEADIKAWVPKLRDGGLLMGHDYHVINGLLDVLGVEPDKVYPDTSWVSVVRHCGEGQHCGGQDA